MMKVLFVSYPHVGLGSGGMYRQIVNTKAALEEIGVHVIVHDFMRNDLRDVDSCHVFGSNSSSSQVVSYCKNQGIPIVISTVFNKFSSSSLQVHLESFLYKRIPGFLGELKAVHRMLLQANKIVVLGEMERVLLEKYFTDISQKIVEIPNGIDRRMVTDKPIEKTGALVLNVAAVNERKNQLSLIYAAENQPWSLALVGPLHGEQAYINKCREAAENMPNVKIYGEFPYGSADLKKLYSEAKVFCLPSTTEVQPLVLLEAAGHNCNLVVSKSFPLQSFLECVAIKVAHDNPESIRMGIHEALNMPSGKAWGSISKEPQWHDIAVDLKNIYEELINNAHL